MATRDENGRFVKGSKAPAHAFKKGEPSWNKGTTGLMNIWNKGVSVRLSPKSEFKKGMTPWNKGVKGYKQPDGTGQKISLANRGENHYSYGMESKSEHYQRKKRICGCCGKEFTSKNINPIYCSKSCMGKMRKPRLGIPFTEESKLKISLKNKRKRTGENNYQWVKDRTWKLERHRLMSSIEWKLWRELVFKRDKYTCQECKKHNCYLEPHHIVPLRVSLESIFDLDNGITLCKSCHKKTLRKEESFINRYRSILKQAS